MSSFAERLLRWHAAHGRHDLPWQHPREGWRVWVSEIMLQQTQVVTVIPYFQRFMQRFPSPEALADSPLDDLLALWAGLGYYSRARNLHAAAVAVRDRHQGRVPQDYGQLLALPGIGPSTAAAICAQAFGQRHAILDANVKRVLARHAGIEGWPGSSAVHRRLQGEADARLPAQRLADYSQAIMDLGAGLCRARAPDCPACPVAEDCVAHSRGLTGRLPEKRRRPPRPLRQGYVLLCRNADGALWLQRRPPAGIWGGLWAPPIVERLDKAVLATLGIASARPIGEPLRHGFTHFVWELRPALAQLSGQAQRLCDEAGGWFDATAMAQRGLPVAMRRIIDAHLQDAPGKTA